MKILSKNLKEGYVKMRITNLDDLWYLSHIIEEKDHVKGRTTRKVKIGTDNIKKSYFLEIVTEKTEFADSVLRVSGLTMNSPEEVENGAYHSFSLQVGDEFSLIKDKWNKIQLDKLHEAEKEKADILICSIDRDSAAIALLKAKGFQIVSRFKSNSERKGYKADSSDFFKEMCDRIKENLEKYKTNTVVIACPGIWHKQINERLDPDLRKKTVIVESTGGEDAIEEVLKGEGITKILKEDRTTREIGLVEELLKEIATSGKAEYGLKQVRLAVDAGAVDTLLVSDKYLKKAKQDGKYKEIDILMENVENMKGKICIISSEHQGGKKLDGLGGVCALLRYKYK